MVEKKKKGCCGGGGGGGSDPNNVLTNGMDDVMNGRHDQQSAKIIVMGNKSVGKTSLIKAYLEGQS